ncbi:M50 family metallopeptidase [Herpetosiphon geysericola]|uniref:Peptidase M50 n=1 Tax=Herpetosiphon geysericola TaxID=70996 RepID=A0A0P6XDS5_9CHLR|nr:M50 family metallopeptidase [Herpetosiphon geysericola]KPL81169.1 hypothetical protein SE18_20950 [Herpetosiphon geysericola]
MLRNNELWIAIAIAVTSTIIARLPVLHWLVYPFELFNTFVHELGHGFATLLTGGKFDRFEVYANGEGVAWTAGGIRWIVASAGYLSSALVGGALLILSARGISANRVTLIIGIALFVLCGLFVRNLFGILVGVVLAGAFIAASYKLALHLNEWLLLILGVQTILNALDSLWDLLRLSSYRRHVTSDALIMQQATGVPAILWALVWSGIALLILWQAIRFAYFRDI